MYILAFDTSCKKDSCSILNMNGDVIISLNVYSADKSENILNLIDLALKTANISIQDIKKIGVCTGPGSFTGARIGVATAIGLSKSLGIEVYGLSRFDISNFVSVPTYFNKNGTPWLLNENNKMVSMDKDGDLFGKMVDLDDLDLTNSEIIARILLHDKDHKKDLSVVY